MMKITLLWQYPDAYLRSFYARNRHAVSLSYELQLKCLLDDYMGWPAAVGRRLGEAGHDVQIIVANAQPLQYAWATQHNVPVNAGNWQFSLPLAQVQDHKPDALWVGSMFQYYGKYMKQLKQLCRRVFAWIACPMPPGLDLSHIDCIVTSHSNFAQHFRKLGKPSELLLPAFEPRILNHLGRLDQDIPISFVGSLSSAHAKRARILSSLVARTPIELWGYGYRPPRVDNLRSLVRWLYYLRNGLPRLGGRYRGEAWGLEMYRILHRSQISVNVHIDVASGIAGNMRLFEATGVGTLLLTERSPNLSDLYEVDQEVATYGDPEELVEVISYYLVHDTERREIAARGQRRTLEEHNTEKRSQDLEAILSHYC